MVNFKLPTPKVWEEMLQHTANYNSSFLTGVSTTIFRILFWKYISQNILPWRFWCSVSIDWNPSIYIFLTISTWLWGTHPGKKPLFQLIFFFNVFSVKRNKFLIASWNNNFKPCLVFINILITKNIKLKLSLSADTNLSLLC